MRIKTGKNETEGKENDSIQESKTQAMNHVATASVVEQLSAVAANKMFKTFLNPSPAVLLRITNTPETRGWKRNIFSSVFSIPISNIQYS